MFHWAKAGGLQIGDVPVDDSEIYRTGKYDLIYTPTYDFQFPDEGIRFYLRSDDHGAAPHAEERLNWVHVRPSGTGNSLRFHIQLHSNVDVDNLIDRKAMLHAKGQKIMDDLRKQLDAPRES